MFMGIELIAIAIFTVSFIYFRSPVVAGVIGNLSSLGMILGVILVFIKKRNALTFLFLFSQNLK